MKTIKKIAVEYSDGTKEIIFGAEEQKKKEEPKPKEDLSRFLNLPKTIAWVVKIDAEKESHRGGTYQRHYLRNAHTNETYILDVNKFSTGVFKHLVEGDTLANLQTFTQNGKAYINGRSKPELVGRWSTIKSIFEKKPVGFTI